MTAPTTAADIAAPDDLDPLRAPRFELGRPANLQVVYSTRGERQWQPKYADPNPALRFPMSVKVWDVMSRTDDQVDAVMRAITLPLRDAAWDLDTKGVDPAVTDFVRQVVGLPAPGEALPPRPRGAPGIVFAEHLREALDCLIYGFMPFEQTYQVTYPGEPGHPEGKRFADRPAVHLRKLAARNPATLRRIRLDKDGGLVSVIQNPPEGEPDWFVRPDGEPGVEIPVSQLVMYVNDRKGADWTGVSILRSAYRPWKVKEQLIRLDAIAAERNSLGLPVVTYDEAHMSREDALDIATQARNGAEAGIALPQGAASIEFKGVSGTVVDLGPKIEQYNQAIGRASLAMFLNLGHDNGARALGDTFMAFFSRALGDVAGQFARTFTEHVIRDLVDWNFTGGEPYPRLIPGDISTESGLAPDALHSLVESQILTPDDVLESTLRRRYRLPPVDKKSARSKTPDGSTTPTDNQGNPLEPKAPDPKNPFKPAGDQQAPPDGKPADGKPGDKAPADQGKPAGGGGSTDSKEMGDPDDDTPDGYTRVGTYIRRKAGQSLSGYAAYLAAQVAEAEQ